VQRALVQEVGRGLDIFRSAVIDSLGVHRAVYATDAIAGVARIDGPLQDDAVRALGRIGGKPASSVLAEIAKANGDIALTALAAQCLVGENCSSTIAALVEAASAARGSQARMRTAVAGLAAIAESDAVDALVALGARGEVVRDEVSVALAGTAVRQPEAMLAWLGTSPDGARQTALRLLKDGFDALEEDFGEEQFFARARAAYWKAPDGSTTRTLMASIIDVLEF
jgi:hypothetical protein